MKAITSTKTSIFFGCPDCGSQEHTSQHLKAGDSFGPWYCDICGCGIRGVADGNGGADIEETKTRTRKTLSLLRLRIEDGEPVHIIVEGLVFYDGASDPVIDQDKKRYFYEEHTCPSNFLGCLIKEGADTDPHGLFEHQETVFMPEDYDSSYIGDFEQWQEIFPSLCN